MNDRQRRDVQKMDVKECNIERMISIPNPLNQNSQSSSNTSKAIAAIKASAAQSQGDQKGKQK